MRKELIRDLNRSYEINIETLSKQELAYSNMVESHPPRCLSGYTYEENPKPLRSNRIAVPPVETDVICFVFYIYPISHYFKKYVF